MKLPDRARAAGWSSRLKIAHKLLVASAVFALPIVVLVFYVVTGFNRSILLGEREMEGARVLEIMPGLLHDIRAHEAVNDPGRMAIAARIEEALNRLGQVSAVELSEPYQELQTQWRRINAQENGAAPALYREFASATAAFLRDLGDSSGLVLDPALDSYHLMEVALMLAPQAQDEALRRTLLTRISHAVETSLREDRKTRGSGAVLGEALPRAFTQYKDAVEAVDGPQAEQEGTRFWSVSIEELRRLIERRAAETRSMRFAALSLSLIAVAAAVAAVLLVGRSISRPLQEVVELASDIAAGRLREVNERLSGRHLAPSAGGPRIRDEAVLSIQAFVNMTGSLNALLVQVRRSSEQIAGSASTVSAAVRQLEAAVAEQTASTSEVNATSKEIHATVQHLARTISEVTEKASAAAESARGGMDSLKGIHIAIDELVQASGSLAVTLQTINAKTRNIDEVIEAITKIANRTNLLSLNAAIEAETAGSKAGGFSVVALEIRRLADQTAAAALDIERLISDVQGSVREGADGVEEHARETRSSSVAIDGLTTELSHVIEHTQGLGPAFEQVNESMQTQAQAAAQIAESMQHLHEAASQTKGSLSEFRRVSEELWSAVETLQSEVGRFSTAG